MRFSLGMAVVRGDFGTAYMMAHWLLATHPEAFEDGEILIVDNDPGQSHSKRLQGQVAWLGGKLRYVPFGEIRGTAAPRNKVFEEARGDIVMCCDPHLWIPPGALIRLLEWADANSENRDLWQGPMLADSHGIMATHMDPSVWRDQMWGIWAVDDRGKDPEGEPFEIPAHGLGLFACRKDAWLGFNADFRGFGAEECYIHEKYRQAGRKTLCFPWLPWGHMFGDPEVTNYGRSIADRSRNYVTGARELGLPLNPIEAHFVRGENMREGLTRLGQPEWEMILAGKDPMFEIHGIKDGEIRIPPGELAAIENRTASRSIPVQAVIKFNEHGQASLTVDWIGAPPKVGRCGGGEIPKDATLESLYLQATNHPSDINEHLPLLKWLASQCDTVVEFGVRHAVSTVGLLAGQPRRLWSCDLTDSPQAKSLGKLAGKTKFEFIQGDSLKIEVEACDLLFIDTKHTAAQLRAELARHAGQVRRWIALHDTVIFGEHGDDGSDGLLFAVREFLRLNPAWFTWKNQKNNNGFMVLSKRPEDRKPLPRAPTLLANFAKAIMWHAADGFVKVSQDQLQERLSICQLCPSLRPGLGVEPDKCAECGCPLTEGKAKATMRSEPCPLGNWPEVT